MSLHSETILDSVVAAIAAISTGSGATFTPAVAERFDRFNTTKGPLPNLQISRGRLDYSRQETGGNWTVDLEVEIQCALLQTAASGTRSDKAVNLAFGDIALAVINMDWQALKANLGAIRSIPYEDLDENEPETGIVVTFGVQYKLAFDDLTVVVDPQ